MGASKSEATGVLKAVSLFLVNCLLFSHGKYMERSCLVVWMLNEGRGLGGRLLGCILKLRARGAERDSDQRSKFVLWWHHDTGVHLKLTLPQRVAQVCSEEKCKGKGCMRKWCHIKFMLPKSITFKREKIFIKAPVTVLATETDPITSEATCHPGSLVH